MAVLNHSYQKVKKLKLPSPGSLGNRARETLKHLEHGWLPVHPDLLTGIQANIKNDHYQDHPELLIQDIKKDPGLFFTVAKRLKRYSDPQESGFDPFALLSQLEKEQLTDLFQFEAGDYSLHRAEESSPSQELIHEISRIGGESAFTFAEEVDQPALVAHAGALFRQLGLSLIAWNYPKLFTQALSLHRTKGVDFDRELQNYFQIAPAQIGARMARELEMSREIKQSLIPHPGRELIPGQDIRKQIRLNEITQLSELFARAKEPSFFPAAEEAWAAKECVLTPLLGKELFQTLHEKAALIEKEEQQATDFGDLNEYIAKTSLEASPPEGLLLPKSNPHLAECPPEVQSAFVAVHRELERSKRALDAIRLLIERGIPETGVKRGALYLQRKDDFRLQAALRFGEVPLPHYQRFLLDSRNGIFDAVHSRAPFVHEGKGVSGEQITQVRGGLGDGAPPGVLYIEISDKAAKSPNYNPIVIFHVIRAALQDCLKSLEDSDRTKMSFY